MLSFFLQQFEIELQLTDDSICYVTSRIILRHTGVGQERMVWHLQYTDWPDHGCPEDTYGFLGKLSKFIFCVFLSISRNVNLNFHMDLNIFFRLL